MLWLKVNLFVSVCSSICMAKDYCPECNRVLTVTTEQLRNGDEIKLLWCDFDGLYSVYDSESDSVVTDEYHNCSEGLISYHHKRNNGDRLIFDHCPSCGFYSAGNDFQE